MHGQIVKQQGGYPLRPLEKSTNSCGQCNRVRPRVAPIRPRGRILVGPAEALSAPSGIG